MAEERLVKFEWLDRLYRGDMFHAANSILRDSALAEEAARQAFSRILSHMDKITQVDSRSTKSLMIILARNIATVMNHSQHKDTASSFDEVVDWRPDTVGENGDEDYQELVRTLRMLPEGYRNILLLRYDNHFSVAEISDLLGIAQDVIRIRLQRARQRLADLLNRI